MGEVNRDGRYGVFSSPQLSYNTYIILIIAIYATIKEYIKFVKEKNECCVQGVMARSCESCLSLSQYVTTAETNG